VIFFVRARVCVRAYMSLIASAVLLAAASPVFAATDCAGLVKIASAKSYPEAQGAMKTLTGAGPECMEAIVTGMAAKPRAKGRFLVIAREVGDAAVPSLVDLLARNDLSVQAGEALLAAVSAKSYDRIPALIACAQKPSSASVCQQALVQASSAKAKGQTDLLAGALKAKDAGLRASAALALAMIGPKASGAKEALVAALKDRETPVRLSAARALGALGRKAKDAVPALQQMTQDPDAETRHAAVEAIKSIKG
jgi:hypothetical protein